MATTFHGPVMRFQLSEREAPARSVGAAAAENPVRVLESLLLTIARERNVSFAEAVDVAKREAPEKYEAGTAQYGRREPKVRLTSTERQRQQLLAEVNKRVTSGTAGDFAEALSQLKSEGEALYVSVAADYAVPDENE